MQVIMSDESKPLVDVKSDDLGTSKCVKIFGDEVGLHHSDFHFVFVLPHIADKSATLMPNAEVIFQKCVKRKARDNLTNWRAKFRGKEKDMTNKAFQVIIWELIVSTLTGSHAGFSVSWMPSIDEDELFLCVKLENLEVARTLARTQTLLVPVTDLTYGVLGKTIPKINFLGEDGSAAASLPYSTARDEAFQQSTKRKLEDLEKKVSDLALEGSGFTDLLKLELSIAKEVPTYDPEVQKLKSDLLHLIGELDAEALLFAVLKDLMAREAGSTPKSTALRFMYHLACEHMEKVDQDSFVKMLRLMEGSGVEAVYKARESRYDDQPSVEAMKEVKLFNEFRDIDYIRIVTRVIEENFDCEQMENHGVIRASFVPHKWDVVEQFMKSWANPLSFVQWPNTHLHAVRDYFGERTAFFFHWMDSYLLMLFGPGLVGLILLLRFVLFDDLTATYIVTAFSFVMCAWLALATAKYNQQSNERTYVWATSSGEDDTIKLRDYLPEMNGSFQETFVRLMHWLLAVVILVQTVLTAAKISEIRREARDLGDGIYVLPIVGPLKADLVYSSGAYIITANIKIVSFMWDTFSPMMAKHENWETDVDKQNSMNFKTFGVKFVVYYYPFFYTAFVKPFVEGCGAKGPLGCRTELRANMTQFLAFHIAITIAFLLIPMVQAKWAVSKEIQSAAEKSEHSKKRKYNYLQLQAKLPPSPDDSTDYMDTIINLGFVTMFSCICPIMTFLCLMTFIVEVRLFALRSTYLSRRPIPRRANGIGVWMSILKTMAVISVITNVGFICFMMEPFRGYKFHHQLLCFLFLEHSVLLLVLLLGWSMAPVTIQQSIAEEINNTFLDEMVSDPDLKHAVAETQLKSTYPELDQLRPTSNP